MEVRYKAIVRVFFRLTDAAVVVAAWVVSYWARFFLPSFPAAKDLPPFGTYASLVPLIATLWILVFSYSGVYESGRLRARRTEVLLILRAHAIAIVLFVAIAYSYDAYRYSRLVMFYFGALGAVTLTAFRVTLRTALRWMRAHGHDTRRVVLVGTGPAAHRLCERFQRYPELGIQVVGVLTHDGNALDLPPQAHVLGSFADIARVVEATRAHQVMISLPPGQQGELPELLSRLSDSTVRVRVVPDLQEYAMVDCQVEQFEGLPVIRLNDTHVDELSAIAKRALDVVVSALGLVVISPLLLTIAVLVKLTSKGPVLFAQERMGLDGRTFLMLKFRSMRLDAEARSGAVWASRSDDRRTRIGALLRNTSLDELPQLGNVLMGQMSLVGPRPERPVFVQEFRRQIPDYMLRHRVKSGITGWAQIHGWRGDTSLVERTACDIYYVRNWSFQLDLKILTMTLWRGFINKNAY
jgi:Undecaprenyl-phosphate glucose phosphotransferase